MVNNRFIIIGRSSCPYCVFAIDFCRAKDLETVFLDYSEKTEILEDYKSFYERETVPIILENSLVSGLVTFIGGYTDLLDFLK